MHCCTPLACAHHHLRAESVAVLSTHRACILPALSLQPRSLRTCDFLLIRSRGTQHAGCRGNYSGLTTLTRDMLVQRFSPYCVCASPVDPTSIFRDESARGLLAWTLTSAPQTRSARLPRIRSLRLRPTVVLNMTALARRHHSAFSIRHTSRSLTMEDMALIA